MRPLRGSALIEDLQEGAPALAPFYFGHPADPEAFRRKAEEVSGRFDADRRARMAAAVRPTSPRAAERLRKIAAGEGFFVTTGQQAGLFTGPLYTIYKALSAARLAGELENRLGCPVAPLFWVASEDHDWDEVRHAELLDSANELHRIELPADGDSPPRSMARRLLGPEIEAALDATEQLLPPTEFRDVLLQRLRAAYHPGAGVAEAFAAVLGEWLAPFDFLIVDAADRNLARLSVDVLRRELDRSVAHERIVAEQTARLEAAGYEGPVGIVPGAANVFFEDDSGRERLLRTDDGWELRRSRRRFTAADLDSLLESEPERFSPNVLLRPVVESAAFPTLAYVGGPAEVGYFAQIGCLFRAHDLEMPLAVPRASVLMIESKVEKVLSKFGLEPDLFRLPLHEVAARVLREEIPQDVKDALADLAKGLQEGYARLLAAASAVDPTLAGPLKSARNTSLREVGESEKKVAHHLKQQNTIGVEQLEKVAANLYPSGKPQERVLTAAQYLGRYGPDLLQQIARAIPVRMDAEVSGWDGVDCG